MHTLIIHYLNINLVLDGAIAQTNADLLVLIEKMKEEKDKGGKYVAFLTDLSTAFNCLHDLLIAKLHAYDFETDSLIYRIIKIGNNCNTQQEYFLEYPKVLH